jgi:hypothetical protein
MEEHVLKNGIIVSFEDQSKILSGDLWFIRIKIFITSYLTNEDDELKRYCGEKIVKIKTIERPAVLSSRLEQTKNALIESYLNSTLHYMETPTFLKRFKAKEMKEQLERIEKERKMRAAGIIL